MSIVMVTGTGTEVGKTVVTAALAALAAARGPRGAGSASAVAVVKPAQTGIPPGAPGDLAEVARLAGVADLHEYARYPDPLSPAAAARVSGLPPLALDEAAARIRRLAEDRDLVLVEGAGGLLVRYDEDGATLADLARELRAPLVVVADPALGTLNHTALTLEAMAARGLDLAGIVLGSWPGQGLLGPKSSDGLSRPDGLSPDGPSSSDELDDLSAPGSPDGPGNSAGLSPCDGPDPGHALQHPRPGDPRRAAAGRGAAGRRGSAGRAGIPARRPGRPRTRLRRGLRRGAVP